jgi:hypothetical protein
VLSLHGFESYPDSFQTLIELADLCGQAHTLVVLDVLLYLDKLKMLDRMAQKCPWVP